MDGAHLSTSAAALREHQIVHRDPPPGPPPRAPGTLGRLRYYLRFAGDPIAFVAGRFERYGDLYCVRSEDGLLFVLRHPEHIRQVLLTHAGDYRKTHSAFDRLQQVLGDGLLTSDGETWKRHRRMVQPAFHHRRLAQYGEVMVDEALGATQRWSDGDELDVGQEMMDLTLRIVARTLFSHDVGHGGSAQGRRRRFRWPRRGGTPPPDEAMRVGEAMRTFQDAIARPDLLPEWMPTPGRKRLQRAVATLDDIIYRMIEERRSGNGPRRDDLLQRLLDTVDDEGDGGALTEREVRDELVTLFLAGHETTAQALTWTWYLLSHNPEPRRKLQRELAETLAGRPPRYEDLPSLPYTEQVIKEAMRLYPPAYVLGRRACHETELGGHAVPRGSEVVIWTYMTHRDPRWYPHPYKFDPDRFSPEHEAQLPKMAYLPFGGGPRACIGKGFAMVEARLILATIAQRAHLELVPDHPVDLKPRITLTPRHGIRLRARTAGHGAALSAPRAPAPGTPARG